MLDLVARGEWTYEVHSTGAGTDLYRDALSWSPFHSPDHARAAGAALARLHLAAEGFDAPRRQVQPLVASFTVFASGEPVAAPERYVAPRPELAMALSDFPRREDTERVLTPLHRRLAPHLPGLTPLWTHNDWHASNLLWDTDGEVSTVLDSGMSDRTTAVHDLATAIERNAVQWLRPGFPVREEDALALLDGYESVRPLSAAESAALPELLPLGPRGVRAVRAGALPRRDPVAGEHPAGVRLLRRARGVVHRGERAATAGPAAAAGGSSRVKTTRGRPGPS